MTTDLSDLLKQYREMEATATGGEWHSENGTIWVQVTDREGLPCQQELAGSSPADAALIVFLRNNAPRFFALLEAAEGVEKALSGMLRHSCVADADPNDKDEEDHAAERTARNALSAFKKAKETE